MASFLNFNLLWRYHFITSNKSLDFKLQRDAKWPLMSRGTYHAIPIITGLLITFNLIVDYNFRLRWRWWIPSYLGFTAIRQQNSSRYVQTPHGARNVCRMALDGAECIGDGWRGSSSRTLGFSRRAGWWRCCWRRTKGTFFKWKCYIATHLFYTTN